MFEAEINSLRESLEKKKEKVLQIFFIFCGGGGEMDPTKD